MGRMGPKVLAENSRAKGRTTTKTTTSFSGIFETIIQFKARYPRSGAEGPKARHESLMILART